MERKRILLVNDMVGCSKVGMGAMLPVLSYMGYPTFSLPTALVSNTLDYGIFNIQDTTDYISQSIDTWGKLGFGFDAICTGLMFNPRQARLISQYCNEQKEKGTFIAVDPIMGDGGRYYNGISAEQTLLMREMVSVAHLALPNYTEAAYLTDMPYQSEGISWNEAKDMTDLLRRLGSQSVVITSCRIGGKPAVAGYSHADNDYFLLHYQEIPGLFHGTGDLFSAVLLGHLLDGKPLQQATRTAMDAVYMLLDLNRDMKDRKEGILVERFLNLLPPL